MRIGIVTLEYVTESNFDGGFANHFYKLAKGFKALGHEPLVFTRSELTEEIEHEGIKVYRTISKPTWWFKLVDKITRFKFYRSLGFILYSYWFKKRILSIHKKNKIDVLLFSSAGQVAFFKPRKIPAVILAGGRLKVWNEANGVYNKTLQERQLEILDDWIFRREKNIYAPSHFLSNHLERLFNKSIPVIETPFAGLENITLDHSLVNKIKAQTSDKPYILFFGRLGLWKGTIDIADALPKILSKYPQLHFVFIGKDKGYKNETVMEYIYKKVPDYKDQVIYIPPVKHEVLFPVIDNSLAVILPSRAENLSNASIETMSMGKILIGTRGASFDQLITDEENGFLCEISDPESIALAVNKLMNLSEEEKNVMEQKAKKRIDLLHPDIVVKELLDYFEKVAD